MRLSFSASQPESIQPVRPNRITWDINNNNSTPLALQVDQWAVDAPAHSVADSSRRESSCIQEQSAPSHSHGQPTSMYYAQVSGEGYWVDYEGNGGRRKDSRPTRQEEASCEDEMQIEVDDDGTITPVTAAMTVNILREINRDHLIPPFNNSLLLVDNFILSADSH